MRPHAVGLAFASVGLAWSSCVAAADIDQATMPVPVVGGSSIEARVFTVDTGKFDIDVLPASALGRGRPRDDAEGSRVHVVSLKDAARSAEVGRAIARRALLVNGGFTDNDRPDGLLIYRDQVVSLPNFAVRAADQKSSCPALRTDHKRIAGALCVARDRSTSILPIEKVKAATCYQALQAGPILVAPGGQVDVCRVADGAPKEYAAQARTALCLRGGKLSVVLTLAPVELFDLATWLSAPVASGGLACDSALNLAGGAASGVIYFPGGFASVGAFQTWGASKQRNASYLLIHSLK